jgi:helicase MOV-10
MQVSNRLFYDDMLQFFPSEISMRMVGWPMLANASVPLLLVAVRGHQDSEYPEPSLFNLFEVFEVLQWIDRLIASGRVRAGDIGVICCYHAQKMKLLKALSSTAALSEVEVGTVEEYQGREKVVTIVTTTRTRVHVQPHHRRSELVGFLSNPRRFNVALTRAQAMMIIVGDPRIWTKDPCWASMIEFGRRHRVLTGDQTLWQECEQEGRY